MNKEKDDSDRKKPGFPLKMTCFTIVILAPIFLAQIFPEKVRDFIPAYEAAFANLLLMVGSLVLILSWSIYLLFFSRRGFLVSKVVPILLLLCTIGFFVVYQPVFNGSMGITSFENRFLKDVFDPIEVSGEKVVLATPAKETNFYQFFGPNRNGVIDSIDLQTDWESDPPVLLWKNKIGQGWCGFAAYGNYAYTMEQRNELEIVTCRNIRTGDIVWSYEHEARHEDPLGGIGPRATPTVHEGLVYAQGGTGILLCLDATNGDLKWEKNLPDLVGITMTERTRSNGVKYQVEDSTLMWGRSASPLIHGDEVIMVAGGPADGDQTTFIAFDKKSGEETWRGGNLSVGYASPIIEKIAGVEQILLVTENKAAGFEVGTGKVLWAHDRPGHSNGDANSQQMVVVDQNRLLLTKGYGLGGELIKVTESGGEWNVESVWKNSRVLKTKFTNAILNGRYAFAISEKVLECVDVESGERLWRQLRVNHGQMLRVGNHLVVQNERGGEISIVDATNEWNGVVAKIKRPFGARERCWNTLCVQDSYLLIRSESNAACFELPIRSKAAGGPRPDPNRK